MPDAASKLAVARRTLDRALAGLVPQPVAVRAAIEELIAAKLDAVNEEAAREMEARTRDHNRPTGA